jgi:hypothetical protein
MLFKEHAASDLKYCGGVSPLCGELLKTTVHDLATARVFFWERSVTFFWKVVAAIVGGPAAGGAVLSAWCSWWWIQIILGHARTYYGPEQNSPDEHRSIEHGPIVAAIVGGPAAGGAVLSAWCSWWWIQIILGACQDL